MWGEMFQDPSKVIAIKTHEIIGIGSAQAIAVVRDPLHAALAFQSYEKGIITGGHSKEIPEEELRNSFHKTLTAKLRRWKAWASFFKDRKNTLVIRYEDLIVNTKEICLKQIYPFLHVNPDRMETRLDCAIKASNDNYEKTRRKHSYVFTFTDDHKDILRKVVGDELLHYYGYSLDR